MKRQSLTWWQLRFPQELDESAVLAALANVAGLPAGSRVVFDLSADHERIVHRVGITERAADIISGALRAAIPSLRLDLVEPPAQRRGRGLRFQLAPAATPLLASEAATSAAALLASMFPLTEEEYVQLRWELRPAPHPRLEPSDPHPSDGRRSALRQKLGTPGMQACGDLVVVAKGARRTRQLLYRTAAPLRSLSSAYGRLLAEPRWFATLLFWLTLRGRYMSVPEIASVIGWPIGNIDLPNLELGAAKRLVPTRTLASEGRLLGFSNAAGVRRPVAISPQASTKGLWILGPTGTGKTSLIKGLVAGDLAAGRGLAVVETNGDLIQELLDLVPPHRVKDVVLLDATDREFAVGFNPLASQATPSLVADQLNELFQRLWSRFWGPRTAQLAHMGLLTLAGRQNSTLLDLPRLYMDQGFRRRLVGELDDPIGLEPDWRWYESLQAKDQAAVVAPLMNKVRAFTAREAIRGIMGVAQPATSMQQIMREGRVLLVHIPKGLIGAETSKLLGCLVLTSLWQAATERAQLPVNERRPFSLYVDEVQDFASAPIAWDEMFAQGRKYGLALTVAHQNLDQLEKPIREIILANARSKVLFALSASDAKTLERLFSPALTAADLQALDPYSVAAQVALDDGSIARPVTLNTHPPPKSLSSAAAVRAASRATYAKPRAEIEAGLRATARGPRPKPAPVGRRRRPVS